MKKAKFAGLEVGQLAELSGRAMLARSPSMQTPNRSGDTNLQKRNSLKDWTKAAV
ncbi:hypothetical protein [Leptolyngbya sp. FACHB-711]|uniref:hypothetical protein n=1 Tax=Leptolyngbya sp. FACHB-711 TaxID=2692813 RepID=UPI0016897AA5|nr:hypothetical protein [Leptolyngbya sp. FACHB-711]MBD1849689.1 hypothetical protein [Cyanobacteria bacterium FACHB-502]MBD2023692.1 hypothetical protein [Leptolyngbya sp. FACHB-711]